ncbi:hypothetical protein DFH29DRAFT_883109 [Suillus ampliporus]|nr:hypothetical protein DFH29DRAFT_883109 [Suillus ampliporus]
MPQYPVFSPFSEVKENELEVTQKWVPSINVVTRADHQVGSVPPPSRPFHVVKAPARAKEGPARAKEVPQGPPEHHFPLQPFRQTPGPIMASQTYLRTLVLERWDAEIRRCDDACKAQLTERVPGPLTYQTLIRELIIGRWCAEKQRCQEARKVQLLELLLAAHGITSLV